MITQNAPGFNEPKGYGMLYHRQKSLPSQDFSLSNGPLCSTQKGFSPGMTNKQYLTENSAIQSHRGGTIYGNDASGKFPA